MPLLTLPNELILRIAHCLLRCPTCDCHHISQHLSALSRSNHRLHGLLAEYLLETASTLQILLWAITNSRHDTVALALERGAHPNTPLRPDHHINTTQRIRTPIDVAIQMRAHSVDAESHALKLGTLALLLGAGGTCTVDSLIMPTRCGDLDLLSLCLPRLVDIHTEHNCGPRTLLVIAAHLGYTEVARMMIRAGAAVNSTGTYYSAEFDPPLWVFSQCSAAIFQVLLDEGADATWRAGNGDSVLQHMRQWSSHMPGLNDKIALLVRHGAVDEPTTRGEIRPHVRPEEHPPTKEYRGWMPGSRVEPGDREYRWALVGRADGCGCLDC